MLNLISVLWAVAGLASWFCGEPRSEFQFCLAMGALFVIASEVRELRSLFDDE